MSVTLKRLVAWNFMFGALLVFGWITYGACAGLPINVRCIGFRTNGRSFNAPAWLTPALIEVVFLGAFFVRNYIGQRRVRILIGGFSAWTLLFGLLLPLLLEQIYGTTGYTSDQGFWTYAALSNIAYAIVGGPDP